MGIIDTRFCNSFVFHGHIASRKNRNSLHHSHTSYEAPQKEKKMKRDKMKRKK
jgi:hypothetical protein